MANSEGRQGGKNFNHKQLQRGWKPLFRTDRAGSTVCQHLNEPLECPVCRKVICQKAMKK
jgi:hypothetical protein